MASFLSVPFRWAALLAAGMSLAWAEDGYATRPVLAAGIAAGFLAVATLLGILGRRDQ